MPELEHERWVTLENGLYAVSDHGRAKRTSDGMILKPSTGKLGYPRVMMYINKKQKTLFIHQAVAEHFIGPRPHDHEVDHIDGTRDNNHYRNLQYLTHAENIRKGYDGKRGDNHHAIKISDATASEIMRRRSSGERGSKLSAEYGISQQTVCDIFKGRSRGQSNG